MTRPLGTLLASLALPALLLAHGGEDHGSGAHHDDPSTPAARHGGKVLAAGEHAFEVLFEDAGLHVFPMAADGTPLTPPALSGKVTLRARRDDPVVLEFQPIRDADGRVVHLMARGDFSKIRDGSRKAIFQLAGLGRAPAEFWTVLRRTPGAKMAGSHHGDAAGSDHSMAGSHESHGASGPTDAGKLAMQRRSYPIDWCLVSGDPLGSDGPPIDHVYQGRLVRLCCKGCIKAFEKNPGKYLAVLDQAASGKSIRRPAGSHSAGSGHDMGGHGHGDHGGHSH